MRVWVRVGEGMRGSGGGFDAGVERDVFACYVVAELVCEVFGGAGGVCEDGGEPVVFWVGGVEF